MGEQHYDEKEQLRQYYCDLAESLTYDPEANQIRVNATQKKVDGQYEQYIATGSSDGSYRLEFKSGNNSESIHDPGVLVDLVSIIAEAPADRLPVDARNNIRESAIKICETTIRRAQHGLNRIKDVPHLLEG